MLKKSLQNALISVSKYKELEENITYALKHKKNGPKLIFWHKKSPKKLTQGSNCSLQSMKH